MPTSHLSGIAYELGADTVAYHDAEGFESTPLPRRPDMWGWGSYRRSDGPAVEMAVRSARRTMETTRTTPDRVDRIILCYAEPPDDAGESARNEAALMRALGLTRAVPISLVSGGCTALAAGIATAAALVETGRSTRSLVVSADRYASRGQRFRPYGIFSDAACSCLVSDSADDAFEIVATAHVAGSVEDMKPDAPFDSALAIEANRTILERSGLESARITKVFGNNVFLPITLLKETEAGFKKDQIFLDNVKRVGHCYACDSLINFRDYLHMNNISREDNFMLTSDAPGLRCAVLLRAVHDRTADANADIVAEAG